MSLVRVQSPAAPADRATGHRGESTLGGIRTRKYTHLKRARLPVAARAQVSRRPVPTRAVRLTKAEPQPCAAASLPTVDSNHD